MGFEPQRLRPLDHADSQHNKPNYYVIILNMLKEKSLSRQSRERIFWQLLTQLLVDSYEMEIDSAEN